MFGILAHTVYRQVFAAQAIALLGTGLMTVALGLQAYELAGDRAGAVLGTALAIKMLAYVGLAPVANALAERLPRKAVLIGADLVRAAIVLFLPFIDAIWQIYVLIFLLQAASATFTPAFQAAIPDILEDERDYTAALSLSRLAYDLENLLSPLLAGVLLAVMSFHWLFMGAVVGFLCSAMLVWRAAMPERAGGSARPFLERLTGGARIYLATPRLRGLLALNFAASAVGAFVIVNTVVLARGGYGASATGVAILLAAFGFGSMTAALALPRLLERTSDRLAMTSAAALLAVSALGHAVWWLAVGPVGWPALLALWAVTGALYSAVLTPSGRLLRRSAHAEDRPALFAAQFALSHACWLVAYPTAGWIGEWAGLPAALLALALLAFAGVAIGVRVWPRDDPAVLPHAHPDLAPDHPHLAGDDGRRRLHAHAFVIDDLHRRWPTAS